jgi:hypothetical protein
MVQTLVRMIRTILMLIASAVWQRRRRRRRCRRESSKTRPLPSPTKRLLSGP